jgi:hypothetical protein
MKKSALSNLVAPIWLSASDGTDESKNLGAGILRRSTMKVMSVSLRSSLRSGILSGVPFMNVVNWKDHRIKMSEHAPSRSGHGIFSTAVPTALIWVSQTEKKTSPDAIMRIFS